MLRVSIVEDDRTTRESLIALIEHANDLEIQSAFPSTEHALRELPKRPPDVLLVDINLPGRSGIECVAEMKSIHPKLNVLMLTTYEDTENIFDSLRAGASGYLLKRARASEIITAIKDVADGGSPMTAAIARKVVQHFHAAKPAREIATLTPREHEILTLLADGLHYKEIADKLSISTGTVRVHLHTIYGKLHVQSRTEAVVKFLGR
jgi:DNA-binding NarL/FixJ family response regulator